jgi:tetratricopeptide (TPR) repeat protein
MAGRLRLSRRHAGLLLLALLAAQMSPMAVPASAQSISEQIQTCGSDGLESGARIAACTAALDSGRLVSRAAMLAERAHAFYDRDEIEKALADLDEAVRLAPEPQAYFGRGVVFLTKGEFARAIADFAEGINLAPKAAGGYYNRGMAYRRTGDYSRALDDLNEAIELDPKFAPAYFERSRVHRQLGKCAEAAVDLERAAELAPTAPFAGGATSRTAPQAGNNAVEQPRGAC